MRVRPAVHSRHKEERRGGSDRCRLFPFNDRAMRGDEIVTNEELATLIQNGDDGYLPVLWEQVRRLIRTKAEQYHRYFSLNGGGNYAVDVDDLTQSGYYAVLDAVKYYSPCAGYKFTTYLDKTLKKAFREAMGIRTSKRDPCLSASSLDAGCGEDDDTPLLDLLDSHDSRMVQVEENLYNQELHKELWEILQRLPDAEREALTLRFFFGISYMEQAENKGVSKQSVSRTGEMALERIRRNPAFMRSLSEFMPEYDFDPYRSTGMTAWASTGQSVQEKYLSGLDRAERPVYSQIDLMAAAAFLI